MSLSVDVSPITYLLGERNRTVGSMTKRQLKKLIQTARTDAVARAHHADREADLIQEFTPGDAMDLRVQAPAHDAVSLFAADILRRL